MNKQTFISVVMALIIFALGVVVGNIMAGRSGTVTANMQSAVGQEKTTKNTDNSPTENGSAVAFTISIANLPDSQKAFLRTMGITGDSIPVTNTMFACAQANVGSDRMTAIKNGETPSVGEGVKLAACYKK